MAYDEGLAQRIREQVEEVPGLTEKKMFGGLSFLVNGNLACGVIGEDMIVRVGLEAYETAVREDAARPFDMTGRVMKGWVTVAPPGHEEDQDLNRWVMRGIEFAKSLPAK